MGQILTTGTRQRHRRTWASRLVEVCIFGSRVAECQALLNMMGAKPHHYLKTTQVSLLRAQLTLMTHIADNIQLYTEVSIRIIRYRTLWPDFAETRIVETLSRICAIDHQAAEGDGTYNDRRTYFTAINEQESSSAQVSTAKHDHPDYHDGRSHSLSTGSPKQYLDPKAT